jgi:hypothetical protein
VINQKTRGVAWKKTCFEVVRGLIGQREYENRAKKRKQDFSRNRKMPLEKLMWFMLGMVKESTQNALERFFPKLKEAARMSPAGIQPGAAKRESGTIGSEGSLSGIIPGECAGEL